MTNQAEMAAVFNQARPRLVRIAYAVLGSNSDAEDVVSECWLSLVSAAGREPIRDVEAWATTAVARRALDTLRSARLRREAYVGPWLPEPVVSDLVAAEPDPADRVTLDDTVSFALLVVLEALTPAERTTWVLHDLFGMTFADIAGVVGRTPAAVRQLASRARKHVTEGVPRISVNESEHRSTVDAFLTAAAGGDIAALMAALDPNAIVTSDGGGHVSAARRPVYGSERVARFIVGLTARKLAQDARVTGITVNGGPGLAIVVDDELKIVVSFTLRAGLISRIDMILSPEKLPSYAAPNGRN